MSPQDLVQKAIQARQGAYAPYSHYAVGAALLCPDDQVFCGSNVENASYGLSICAERVAVFKAVTAGVTTFLALAVATRNGASCCGACRQVLREFGLELPIYLASANGSFQSTSLEQLLPRSFGPDTLKS